MPCVIVHVQFHQPFRLHPDGDKFLWEQTQRSIMAAAADRYLPVVRVLTGLTSLHPAFRVTLNASGAFLEQAETYSPPVIRALQDLLDGGKAAGQVEFLEEPYYHSLCGLFGDPLKKEFRDQVAQHRQKMKEVFGYRPAGFVNTELFYTADLANVVADMDYKVMLCEPRPDLQVDPPEERPWRRGIYHVRGRRKRPRDLLVLMRRRSWSERFLRSLAQPDADPEAFARELAQTDEDTVLLGIDPASDRSDPADGDAWAASLGAHLLAFIRQEQIRLATCQEAADHYKDLQCPVIESPQTGPKNPSDWERISLGRMASATQYALFGEIESLEAEARAAGGALLSQWRHLTGANHVFYLRESAGTADPAEAAESSCSNPAVGGQTDDRGVPGGGILHDYRNPYGSPAAAAYVLTRKLDRLQNSIRMFNIRKKTGQTAVIIITPETARLPTEGMGKFAQFVSGKSGGLGEVVSALCKGLTERKIPTHLITLNLRRRFREESRLSEAQWIHSRHNLDPETIHLVSSSIFEDQRSAYDGDPILTAAEFQRQIINMYLKEIRSQYEGRAILHTHDWMAGGAIAAYAKMRDIPHLHTVHNTHTALIGLNSLQGINLLRLWPHLYLTYDQGRECLDAQATAIKSARKISYVGRRFLQEVVEDYFLDRPIIPWSVRQETKIKHAADAALVIPNGISPEVYPEHQREDPHWQRPGLARRFGPADEIIPAKKANLVKFQRRCGLVVDPEAILLYWPSRLDPVQKGIELLEAIAQRFVIEHPDAQIAVVGNAVGADRTHVEILGRIACAAAGRITYHPFDEDLSILGYAAASDVFGASLYEPFGQIDVVGNLYGATATNRDTGGYSDKINALSLKAWGAPQDRGNGVLFKHYDADGLWWGLSHAVEHHRRFRRNPNLWEKQARRIMLEARRNWSLDNMVAGYITAYETLNEGRPLIG